MSNFGVIYVAFGAPYLAMALTSLVSLRVTNPDIPVCIVTNVVKNAPKKPWWNQNDTWVYLDDQTQKNRNAKLSVYERSPFDLTLYLDCDTLVLGDLSPIRRYLKRFELLLSWVYKPNRNERRRVLDGEFRYTEDGHFNGGVFAFRRGKTVEEFFLLWNERFRAMGYRLDQPSLVEAYYLSSVHMFPLPYIWNHGDKWAALSKARNKIVVWHYKVRLEPYIEQTIQRAVHWFGGDDTHFADTRKFLQLKRKERHYRSPRWWVRRIVTKLRGDLSRRLENHPRKKEWMAWTQSKQAQT